MPFINNFFDKNKHYLIILQYIIIVVIFYFLFKNLHKNYYQLDIRNLKLDLMSLLLSFPFLLMSFPLAVYGWKLTLKILKEDVPYWKCFQFSSLTLLVKYIPGYVWPYIGKIYFCKKEGVSEPKAMVSIYIDQWMIIVSGILVFLISYYTNFIDIWKNDAVSEYLPVGFFIFIFLHPRIMVGLLNVILKKKQKEKIKIEIKLIGIFELILIYSGFWLLCGVGFNFFINSIYTIGFDKVFVVAGIFSISWVIGFLSFFVPMGLGVREAALSVLLSAVMPPAIAIVIAIVSRIWLVIPEFLYGGYPLIKKTLLNAKANDPVENLLT